MPTRCRPGATVVYCPRTHAHFGHPPHPWRRLLERGVRVALGTDSRASNPDLDLLAEARFLHAAHPDVAGATLLHLATLAGAEALGWADELGSLTAGKSADFVVIPLPDREDEPHRLLLGSASRPTAVFSADRRFACEHLKAIGSLSRITFAFKPRNVLFCEGSAMPLGYLSLVLHAHLPFVRHPEYEDFLEEDWLYEAITETYIPLLEVFDGLERDGVDWRMTMSVTPTLAAMLADPLLQFRYVRHLDNLIALSAKEMERTRWSPEFHPLAEMYHSMFLRCREVFVNQYGNNILHGFKRFFDTGKLELITCAATHGFMPLMVINENARRAQIEIGCREFERHFGRRPQGIWLAGVRLRRGRRRAAARCRHPLFLHRQPCGAVRRAAAALRRLCADRVHRAAMWPCWPATPNRASRCGAPSKATPAIPVIAISTATSASIWTMNI